MSIQGRPGAETDWATPILDELKSVTNNITHLVGLDNTADYTTAAKNNLNAFAESLKAEAAAFGKSVWWNLKYFNQMFKIMSFTL